MTGRIVGLAAIAFALAPPARADARAYRVARQQGDIGVALKVPYSLGTHTEAVVSMLGEIQLDPETLVVTGGRLVVPISAIRSDSAERDCHLREALGLDYGPSRFPEEHVCDGGHRLPASGPDSVVYPEVIFEVERGSVLDGPGRGTGWTATSLPALQSGAHGKEGQEVRATVAGSWTIHGIRRPARLELTLSKDPGMAEGIRVRGRQHLSLRDHGVVVKSAKVLFATISVKDEVTVLLDVVVVPSSAPARQAPAGG
jgi:polyisoprenoid-binding protein YceI